jgi:hypothetical protein
LRGGRLEMLDKKVNRYSASPLVPVVSFLFPAKLQNRLSLEVVFLHVEALTASMARIPELANRVN